MSSLFKMPKTEMPPEVAMPDREDLKARMAKRSAMMDAQKRRGRESTVLGPSIAEGGGGGEYSRPTLGGSPM